MYTAERAYSYEGAYHAQRMASRPRPKKRVKRTAITASGKKHIILLVLLVGMICVGIIVAGAYAAAINYSNNQLRDSITELEGEVGNLQIEIQSANNIAKIEKKATKELGMIYPEGKQLVVISGEKKVGKNFAGDLKKNALD